MATVRTVKRKKGLFSGQRYVSKVIPGYPKPLIAFLILNVELKIRKLLFALVDILAMQRRMTWPSPKHLTGMNSKFPARKSLILKLGK
jgi:hypothetical protein